MIAGRVCAAALLLVAVLVAHEVRGSAFCDCCCHAAAGSGTPCPGCDIDGNGSVTRDEVTLLGCLANPICAAVFPPPTPTASMVACVGDCDGDGSVTINELLAMVTVALGVADVTRCPSGDANGDGAITVDEILAAVNNALSGCPSSPPASPSVSPTPAASATPPASPTTALPSPTATGPVTTASPTGIALPTATLSPTMGVTLGATVTASPTIAASPTATPDAGLTAAAAGGAVLVVNGMSAIPSVITALVGGLQFGSSAFLPAAMPSGPMSTAGACPLGGSVTRACTGGIGSATLTLTLSACQVPTASGSLIADGTITLQGGGFCPSLILPPWNTTVSLTATFKNAAGTATLLSVSASLTGTISPQLGGSCNATGADLTLNGTLETDFPNRASVRVTFEDTSVAVAVSAFNAQCVPIKTVLTFNGAATLNATMLGSAAPTALSNAAPVTFTAFMMSIDASGTPTQVQVNGGVSAACVGGALGVETLAPLTQTVGDPCPNNGTITLAAATAQSQVFYLPSGAVGLDTNLDGVSDVTFPSCLDARLLICGGAPAATPTGTSISFTATPSFTPTHGASPLPSITPSNPPPATVSPTPTSTPTPFVLPTASATATATATAPQTLFCDSLSPPAIIPDNDPNGITNTIVLSNSTIISDLNVRINVAHTFVGDLVVTLTHLNSRSDTIRLIDRPGLATLGNGGCSGSDIAVTLDDAAPGSVQDACDPGTPTIFGRLHPVDSLSSFDGDALAGAWVLGISDNAPNDVGMLLGWCLEVNAPPSPAPVVTAFTCAGSAQCTVALDQPFTLTFNFSDADGNATEWRMRAVRGDGTEYSVGEGSFAPPSSGGTILVSFTGFTCSQPPCAQSEFDFFLVVLDATNHESTAARVHIIVLASS